MSLSKRSLVILLVLFSLSSCDSNRIMEVNYEFEDRWWHKDSVKNYRFQIPETGNHNIYLNIRNTESYPYHNMFITYFLEDSSGNVLETELVDFNLFHPKTGFPFGNSGIGDVFDHQFQILSNIPLDGQSTYHIKLQQFMRLDSLPEIVSVGIKVESSID